MDDSRIWVFVMWYDKLDGDYFEFVHGILADFSPDKYTVVLVTDTDSYKMIKSSLHDVTYQGRYTLKSNDWPRNRENSSYEKLFVPTETIEGKTHHYIFHSSNELAKGIGYKRWFALTYAKAHKIRYICLLDDNVAELLEGTKHQMPRQFMQQVTMDVLPEEALLLWQRPEYEDVVVFGCSSYCDHVVTGNTVANTWALNKYIIINITNILLLESIRGHAINYDPELELFGEDIDFFIKLHPDITPS